MRFNTFLAFMFSFFTARIHHNDDPSGPHRPQTPAVLKPNT